MHRSDPGITKVNGSPLRWGYHEEAGWGKPKQPKHQESAPTEGLVVNLRTMQIAIWAFISCCIKAVALSYCVPTIISESSSSQMAHACIRGQVTKSLSSGALQKMCSAASQPTVSWYPLFLHPQPFFLPYM